MFLFKVLPKSLAMKLIIISNRLPLKVVENGNKFTVTPSQGGVATGLDSLETNFEKHWVGWPGMYVEDQGEKEKINQQLKSLNYHPVYLTPKQIENFYEGYSNSVLWPMCHYFFSYIHYTKEYRNAYREVNRLFCETVLPIIEPDDIIWIQDYHLMLLPGMIRDQVPDVSIGYFHHIPFPSYELFRYLPERKEVLKGLLGADLIGFHTHSYMRHFISTIYRVLKLDCELDEIHLGDRIVNVDAFPMGINYEKYHKALRNPEIKKKAQELRQHFGKARLMLSVDRLDYSKGILIRLKSFDEFLAKHPEYIGKVSLTMVVSPSRDHVDRYAELKEKIDQEVGAINGIYSTANWNPVYYFYRSFNFEELAALYHIADIALVTPLRDGMNLVAKEFVATKRNQPGILILSEMAGASSELSDAIIVNPTDAEEIGDAIVKALEMPVREQKEAINAMQQIISVQTVEQWAKDFITELQEMREQNKKLAQKIVKKDNLKKIKQQYDQADKRLILLDYDGTLVPFKKNPLEVQPSREVVEILEKLGKDQANKVVISSGRDKLFLEKWLGKLPVGIAAEHGAYYKENGQWYENATPVEWDEEIWSVINKIVKKTPQSKIEVKKTALVFHYRNVDVWLAELRVNQLINALINPVSKHNLQIMKGNKIVEIKPAHFNKGVEAQRLMKQDTYDFIMAIGDDTTDEDMFMVLPENAVSIKVGKNSKVARYNLPTQSQTIAFLNQLIEKET